MTTGFFGWPKQHGKHAPCKTTAEFAEEFGVTLAELKAAMGTSPIPAPKAFSRSTGAGRASYYQIGPMRAWWQAHNQAKARGETRGKYRRKAPSAVPAARGGGEDST